MAHKSIESQTELEDNNRHFKVGDTFEIIHEIELFDSFTGNKNRIVKYKIRIKFIDIEGDKVGIKMSKIREVIECE